MELELEFLCSDSKLLTYVLYDILSDKSSQWEAATKDYSGNTVKIH